MRHSHGQRHASNEKQPKEDIEQEELVNIANAIKTVGPRNCSLISRITGIPIETVRYKIKRQMLRRGIWFNAKVDVERIGLINCYALLKLTETSERSPEEIFDDLSSTGLTYYGKIVPNGEYFCLFAIPAAMHSTYREFLRDLVESGVLLGFEFARLDFLQHISLRPEHYDFKRGKWKVDWSNLALYEVMVNPMHKGHSEHQKVDFYDLYILKELYKDPWVSLTHMANQIGCEPRTLRYHYSSHVIKRGLIANFNFHWMPPSSEKDTKQIRMILKVHAKDELELATINELIYKMPFIWCYGFSGESGVMLALMDLPTDQYYQTLGYISESFKNFRDRVTIAIIDPRHCQPYTIPYELFDARQKEWRTKEADRLFLETLEKINGRLTVPSESSI